MASTEPPGHNAEPRGAPGRGGPGDEGVDDALQRLEERLDRASEAAERLFADAARRVTDRPPPAGWQQPAPEAAAGSQGLFGSDADVLLGILTALRGRIPPELQQRLAEAVREVLLAVRALIDWYLERTARQGPDANEVQDIPIL